MIHGAGDRFGAAIAVGDAGGPLAAGPIADLLIGAPGADRPFRSDPAGPSIAPASSTGAVFALLGPFAAGGSISVDNAAQLLSFYGADSNHRFGQTIAVGDVTGDAIADLVIGAPEAPGQWKDPGTGLVYNMNAHAGAAYVFAGARGFTPQRIDLATGDQLTAYVGLGSAWTGFALSIGRYNVEGNADLIADLIIGAPGGVRDTARNIGGGGGVTVLFGGRTLSSVTTRPRSPFNPAPDLEEVAVFSSPLAVSNDFGFAVAAGDINGDGVGDLIVAAPFVEAAGRAQAGQVQIRFGATKPPGGSGATLRLLPL